ncbi:MAG: CPBP family intramembrane glutamic endopeptidase [Planctomycetota bacterium]
MSLAASDAIRSDPTHVGYIVHSRRPLVVLVFLLPLILAYEVGAVLLLNEAALGTPLVARSIIASTFGLFGVAGLHLPAVLLIVVLLAQHAVANDPLRVGARTLVIMLAESAVWAMPLLVLAMVLGLIAVGGPSADDLWRVGTIAIGAGLYEELVFRLAMIAGVHALLVDVCGVRSKPADVLALIASTIAFAAYHRLGPEGEAVLAVTVFYLIAGLLLGWLFLARGLGIAVGAHAAYDLAVLVVLPALAGGRPEA